MNLLIMINFIGIQKQKNFKGNITNLTLMKDITIGVEYIFHCAAESRIEDLITL